MKTMPLNMITYHFCGALLATAAISLLSSCAATGFSTADTDGSKLVSKKEFERYLLETVYAEADTNRDSRITFAEWKIANPEAEKSKFNGADANKDGSITPTEAQAHFRLEGTIDDLFAKIDVNKSGDVTEAEIEAFMSKLRSKS
jgi:hypothetical protein